MEESKKKWKNFAKEREKVRKSEQTKEKNCLKNQESGEEKLGGGKKKKQRYEKTDKEDPEVGVHRKRKRENYENEAGKEFDKSRDEMNGAKARCLRLECTEGKGI